METNKKILHLFLKKVWYDMIESGEKKEEYRRIGDYWDKRLTDPVPVMRFRHFDSVCFHLGYSKTLMTFECKGIRKGFGNPAWGGPEEEVYIISLGERED